MSKKSSGNVQKSSISNANSSRRKNGNKLNHNGDENVFVPAASSMQLVASNPRIDRRNGKSMHIRHRELIQSVSGATAFTALSLSVNPGIAATFPWLYKEAQGWEQYRFSKIKFIYLQRTSSTTVGSVMLAPDYDAIDSVPSTEAQMGTYQDSVEGAAWINLVCNLDVNAMFPLGPRKFIRSGNVPGADLKTYDAANLIFGVVDFASSAAIGKLWVEYEVEFFVPQTAGSGNSISSASTVATSTVGTTFVSTVYKELLFDTNISDGLSLGTPVAGVYTLPAGKYFVSASASFKDTSAESFYGVLTIYKNGTFVSPSVSNQFAAAALASGIENLTVFGYVESDGTDTLSIAAKLTGAAGTLTCLADSAQLVVRLA